MKIKCDNPFCGREFEYKSGLAHYNKSNKHYCSVTCVNRKYSDKCIVDGCNRKSNSNGLCNMHYKRLKKHGSIDKYKHIMTAEQKKHLSAINKGKKISAETRNKISNSNRGVRKQPFSLEHRLKISKANYEYFQNLGLGDKAPYGNDWTRMLRISIRERDNYSCQICGEKQGDIAHHVHHIDYDKTNCDPKNLITLCASCHMKTNFNTKKWINYFKNKKEMM
jgi:hypothetical protein